VNRDIGVSYIARSAAAARKLEVKVVKADVSPDWCPGCGDIDVLTVLKNACAELEIQPHELLVVSGIGCSSNLPGFIRAYGVHSLHGRALPVASGAKLANHKLHVVAVGGDGDGFCIGVGHFIHAARRNLNLTYILMNNEVYGLTTGQASPTTMFDVRTKTTPRGCARTRSRRARGRWDGSLGFPPSVSPPWAALTRPWASAGCGPNSDQAAKASKATSTTAGTVPNHCAVNPDSNWPNSFEVPMKTISTAITRPRISSGVRSCTKVARMITLTMSAAPRQISETSESEITTSRTVVT